MGLLAASLLHTLPAWYVSLDGHPSLIAVMPYCFPTFSYGEFNKACRDVQRLRYRLKLIAALKFLTASSLIRLLCYLVFI